MQKSLSKPEPEAWHCIDPKHATYYDVEKYAQHLVTVHKIDLARGDGSGKRYPYR